METHKTVEIPIELPIELVSEIASKIPYTCPEIRAFKIRHGKKARVEITLNGSPRSAHAHAPAHDADTIEGRLVALVTETCRKFEGVPVKRIFARARRAGARGSGAGSPGSASGLARTGNLFVYEPGRVALFGHSLALLEFFDGTFVQWARDLEAEPHQYPALIPVSVLDRAEYFTSFPQYLTFASHLPEDIHAVDRFVQERARTKEGVTAIDFAGLSKPTHVLSPAVCYHCYPMIADRTLDLRRPWHVTARGRCYRYESVNFKPLERQWDFQMREIIVIGEPRHVEATRQRLLARTRALMESLDLAGYIESAHDPFFTNESAGKLLLQRLKFLKFELRLALDGKGRTSAVASFNNHEDFFGRTFAVRLRSTREAAHSGCIAFGLERWVNAFLCQHGNEPRRWPPAVRKAIGSAR